MPAMLCSSDSHTYEPADLWTTRLPKALRSSAMHWEHIDGGPLGALEGAAFAEKTGDEPKADMTVSRPLGADGQPLNGGVEERIKALDADGVDREVLLANIGMYMFNMRDGALAMAHAAAYNDYMGETYARRPDRFIPLAAVPLHDIDWAVKEIERTAKLGLRGAMLPIIVEQSYALDIYDPIWAALQDHKMTATFHAATGFDEQGAGIERQMARPRNLSTPGEMIAFRCYSGVEYAHNAEMLIATLVGAGVCERYPKLMFVSAENQAHWLASLMGTMDQAWAPLIGGPKPTLIGRFDPAGGANQPMMRNMVEMMGGGWPFPLKPSEYVRRQVRCTFMDDRMAIACRHITGVETLMWAADYPHPESTYPSSRAIVDELFEGVSEADRNAITAGNLAELYGFEVKPAH